MGALRLAPQRRGRGWNTDLAPPSPSSRHWWPSPTGRARLRHGEGTARAPAPTAARPLPHRGGGTDLHSVGQLPKPHPRTPSPGSSALQPSVPQTHGLSTQVLPARKHPHRTLHPPPHTLERLALPPPAHYRPSAAWSSRYNHQFTFTIMTGAPPPRTRHRVGITQKTTHEGSQPDGAHGLRTTHRGGADGVLSVWRRPMGLWGGPSWSGPSLRALMREPPRSPTLRRLGPLHSRPAQMTGSPVASSEVHAPRKASAKGTLCRFQPPQKSAKLLTIYSTKTDPRGSGTFPGFVQAPKLTSLITLTNTPTPGAPPASVQPHPYVQVQRVLLLQLDSPQSLPPIRTH